MRPVAAIARQRAGGSGGPTSVRQLESMVRELDDVEKQIVAAHGLKYTEARTRENRLNSLNSTSCRAMFIFACRAAGTSHLSMPRSTCARRRHRDGHDKEARMGTDAGQRLGDLEHRSGQGHVPLCA
jgi:hypothetical protein